MKTEPISNWLAQLGLGIKNQSIFDQFAPEGQSGILVLSPLVGVRVDHEVPQLRETSFQIIVRENKFPQGRDLAYRVFEEAFIEKPTRLGDMEITYLRSQNEPIPFQRSEGGNFEFLMNFDIRYQDLTSAR